MTVTSPPRVATRWLILAVLCLAQLTVVLDNTVLNVAIPALTRSLLADTAEIQWMINAYALAQSGLLLTAGGAADRYGRKRMLLIGLALFGRLARGAFRGRGSPGRCVCGRARDRTDGCGGGAGRRLPDGRAAGSGRPIGLSAVRFGGLALLSLRPWGGAGPGPVGWCRRLPRLPGVPGP